MNELIDLSLLRVMSGSSYPGPDGLSILPGEDGIFCLSLDPRGTGLRWSSEKYLTMEMLADMDTMPTLYFDFVEGRGESERILSIRYFMIPTRRVRMTVRLSELDSHRFFLTTYPGTLKGHVEGEPTSIDRIDEVRIRIRKNNGLRRFHLRSLFLSSELPEMRIEGEPLVDAVGQRKGFEWQGKMHGEDELVSYLRKELAAARSSAGYPEDFSEYGGWKKLRFEATGFFRTQFDGRRWWLVDPSGCAFFSNGICYGARTGVHGFVDGMEGMFDWLPGRDDPDWKDCWTEASEIPEFAKRNGVESGRGRFLFNFARANMIRAFGPAGWREAWIAINSARMKRWGFNTIGVGVNTYTDEMTSDFLERAKIPFVVTLKDFPLTKPCIFRDFPDVFSPEYAEGCAVFAEKQLSPYAGNPYFIGYFITNEPEWLFQDSVNPAERVLANNGPLHSKDAFIEFLKRRYGNEVEALNTAWKLPLDSFDELKNPLPDADALSAESARDLADFRDVLIGKYSAVPSDALRKAAPHHLNLGMRYNRLTPNEFAGNSSFDVCSFNCYRTDPFPSLEILKAKDNRPGLIGEWHIAGSEARNFASGLVYSPDQRERAASCVYYLERAMAHPAGVGAHYFEMNDQPLLGRFDGECMQHGLISVCNVPYRELEAAFESLAVRMYEIVNGDRPPRGEQGKAVEQYS